MLRLLAIIIAALLAGCEAPATPIAAVGVPTIAPDIPQVTQAAPLRYGIAAHTLPYMTDIDLLHATALVEAMPQNPDLTLYDMAVAYGVYDGWQQAPTMHHVALVFNPRLAPIDNPAVQSLLRQVINPQAIIDSTGIPGLLPTAASPLPAAQIRNQLANLGFPDGFRLTVAIAPFPGTESVIQQLTSTNIEVAAVRIDSTQEAVETWEHNRAHLLLMRVIGEDERSTWTEHVGAENILDLYSLPISYVASEGITITFTEAGWPVGAR